MSNLHSETEKTDYSARANGGSRKPSSIFAVLGLCWNQMRVLF